MVVTTPWADVLKSLRALRTPQVFVLVLSMTYRYIFLFLHTANGMLLAARARGGPDERRRAARWITGTMGNLMSRAFKMSNDVYAAMLARGFTGKCVCTAPTECGRPTGWLLAPRGVRVAAVLASRVVA